MTVAAKGSFVFTLAIHAVVCLNRYFIVGYQTCLVYHLSELFSQLRLQYAYNRAHLQQDCLCLPRHVKLLHYLARDSLTDHFLYLLLLVLHLSDDHLFIFKSEDSTHLAVVHCSGGGGRSLVRSCGFL